MNTGELWGFILAGLVLVGSPGPATLSLGAAGAAFGFRGTGFYLLGILAAAALILVGVAAGLLTAILSIPHAAVILGTVSFAYLVYLAYRIATAPLATGSREVAAAPGFMTGFGFNLSNPKAYAAFASLFAGFDLVPDDPFYAALAEILTCFSIIVIVDFVWIFAGSALRHHSHDSRKGRIINVSFALLLILSVVPAFFMSFS
jgi:threonine/homoserine/homoserine lactone efflux protein